MTETQQKSTEAGTSYAAGYVTDCVKRAQAESGPYYEP